MKILSLEPQSASQLLPILRGSNASRLLLPNAQKWDEQDIGDLIEGVFCGRSLSIWNLRHILTASDGKLGIEAERRRGGKEPEATAFGSIENLKPFETARFVRSSPDGKLFVCGRVDLTAEQAAASKPELAWLLNSGSHFRDTGFVVAHPIGAASLPGSVIQSVDGLFDLLAAWKAKKYSSQAEWEANLGAKYKAVESVFSQILQCSAVPLLPVKDVDVRVALLGFFAPDSLSIATEWLKLGKETEWEAGLFS